MRTGGSSGSGGWGGSAGRSGSGVSGISGPAGVSGTLGISGTSGGASGISGISGTSGVSGTSGTSGVCGVCGISGICASGAILVSVTSSLADDWAGVAVAGDVAAIRCSGAFFARFVFCFCAFFVVVGEVGESARAGPLIALPVSLPVTVGLARFGASETSRGDWDDWYD
jgi:hypothetical protein